MNVVYIAPLITESIEDRYDLYDYSIAGQNQIRGVSRSIQQESGRVSIISPITPQNRELAILPQEVNANNDINVNVIFPLSINFFGIELLNRIFITLTTTIAVLNQHKKTDESLSLFYNYRVSTGIPALVSQIILNRPAILEYEDGLFARQSRFVRVSSKIVRYCFNLVLLGAICTSSNLEKIVPTNNTTVMRGFPSVGFPDDLPERSVENKVIVMFSGTLDNTRGVDRFLSTIPEIPDENVRFWISGVGTVNQKSCVEQTVERMCDSRITFYGTMSWEQYKEKISSADIFVNFQKPNQKISEYTFPSKILDYLSAGGIVVSTRMGDLEHALGDILVFVDNDVMAMRNGIKRAVQSTKHGNDKQEQAQNWIVNNCTYSDFYDKLQKIYQISK